MPGYIIHLAEAELVARLLKEQSTLSVDMSEQWKQTFFCGNLIPDAVPKDKKRSTHFWDEKDMGDIFVTPCISKFMDKYRIDLMDPLLCGYFTHLYLDQVFYNKYIPHRIGFYNDCGKQEQKASEISYARIIKTGERVSLEKLFSGEYIYGDYTRLNKYFMEYYHIDIPWDAFTSEISIVEAEKCDLANVFYELKMFLSESPNKQGKLKIFSEESLNNFLVETSQAIVDIFRKSVCKE